MGQIEINHTGSGGGVVLSSDGTDLLLGGSAIGGGGGGASAYTIDTKTDNYTAVAGDLGKLIHFTSISADKTLTLTAAATLGAGWFCYVRYSAIASGPAGYAYKVIIDPNGSETIDGEATRNMKGGQTFQILCDGSNFHILSSDESRAFSHNVFYGGVGTYGQPLAQPEASGAYAIALGGAALSSGTGSVALGYDSKSTGSNSFAGPKSTATGQYSVSLGNGSPAGNYNGARGAGSIAIGQTVSNASGSLAIGQYANATGANASAIGHSLASGSHSFAAGITSNSSSYGATGANSVAIGNQAKATGEHSIALGKLNIASNHWAFVGGYENTGSGAYSATLGSGNTNSGAANFCVGYGSTADGDYGAAIGRTVSQRDQNHTLAFGLAGQPWTSGSTPDGASQTRITGYAKQTADASPLPMNGYTSNHSVNANNSFTLPNNAAATFSLTVIANVTGGGNSKAWKLEGAVKRGASASATALIGSVIKTTVAEDSGAANWDVSIAANTTIGGLVITCTGQASTSIRWVGRMDSTEVTY
jgi:hypothetical protein